MLQLQPHIYLTIKQYIPTKRLKISCQKYKMGSLLLSFKCMTYCMKPCSFLHAHFTETMKVDENLFKKTSSNYILSYPFQTVGQKGCKEQTRQHNKD